MQQNSNAIETFDYDIQKRICDIEDFATNWSMNNDENINHLKCLLKGYVNYVNNVTEHLDGILNEVDEIGLENLSPLENQCLCGNIKKSNLYLEWLNKHFQYIQNEGNGYTYKRRYRRREIIRVDFGFNVGSELGGLHYALVVEKNDTSSDSTLVVVPLSTFRKKGRRKEELYPTEVDLGIIEDLAKSDEHIYSYALIDQIRLISKLRIYEPRSNKLVPAIISEDLMNLIDEKIIHFFSSKNINPSSSLDDLDETVLEYSKYKKIADNYEQYFLDKINNLHEVIFG